MIYHAAVRTYIKPEKLSCMNVTSARFCKALWRLLFLNDVQVKPEILSWDPRIILFRNFLSNEVGEGRCGGEGVMIGCGHGEDGKELERGAGWGLEEKMQLQECDYLRAIALPRLHISTVVDAKTGKDKVGGIFVLL
ncbi:hypothetical protein M9H77_30345 [Catharanthus roseus]|uniref:Uncharacterized protein n=1 Tax=Catharanthus roseus TaxID=4058 RepID=A0ACB9ZWZ5_CATRO|nr:hypothetical protein M9H77_30345 [Catharanthus roseus]